MKIIFDCGSTKTSVAIIPPDSPVHYTDLANGYNAMSGGDDDFYMLASADENLSSLHTPISEIHFYGAGCATTQACERVQAQLQRLFPQASTNIHVASDMLGAARSVCQHTAGIVGILGTGSNSCSYDGDRITANIPPLGYILGDEASGAVLGRLFLGMLFKNQFPGELRQKFTERYRMEIPEIITRVYRSPRPNAFLASFAPFIAENASMPEVERFLHDEFSRYVRYNLMNYPEFHQHPIHFIGSIAEHFRTHISKAVHDSGGRIGTIVRAPLEGLVTYHRDESPIQPRH